jgi:two-component system sensor histidine kinase/response regulator
MKDPFNMTELSSTHKIKPKVLISEDNEINIKVLKIILDKQGLSYEVATNGQLALEMYKKSDFDIVLMDCQMPEMDGLSATRLIRQYEQQTSKRHCPIVAMTANAMSGDKEKCLQAGMNDFIAKPFRTQDLIQKVTKWINQEQS